MKKYIKTTDSALDDVFAMSAISSKYVDVARTGDFDSFIYVSEAQHSTGPRLKFYGGTRETRRKQDVPSYTFSPEGPGEVVLQPWMNKQNCPNAFSLSYLRKIETFINNTLPWLLLIWYFKISEADVVQYLYGHIELSELIDCIEGVTSDEYNLLHECATTSEIHDMCKKLNLYRF